MQQIKKIVDQALKDLNLAQVEYKVEHPKDESHGDYSVNVAMLLWGQNANPKFSNSQIKSPRELATQILGQLVVNGLQQTPIEKVEVAGSGFINFYLKQNFFLDEMDRATDLNYGKNENLKNQKTYVEFTDPNPFKEFHIGHLMSNTIGESLARILEANGAEVKRACYQGDVGLHVAKSIWGWQKKEEQGEIWSAQVGLQEKISYLGKAYAYGASEYEIDEVAKTEINALNKVIYERSNEAINKLYDQGRTLSLEYFETIYKRLGTKFDEYFFESEEGPKGLKIVEEGLAKGVFEIGESGAVVFKGEKYGLHTRVFRNKLGLPTYEGKELGLAKTKAERWNYDKSYVITANEIDEYFKVLLKVLNLLYPELGAKTTHLSHGIMKLTTGKMSSRTGKVVTGEGLLNELKDTVLAKMGTRDVKDREAVADQVAVGALKYTVLKQAVGGDITYEPEKMTNLEGDTGPYLQYTYARAQSVIKKAGTGISLARESWKLNTEELAILRWIYRYPEVVEDAAKSFAPHMLSSFIYELATRFNSFYNQHQIMGNEFRVLLTSVVAQRLKSGLELLGIQAPEEM